MLLLCGSSIRLVDVSGEKVFASGTPPIISRLATGAVVRNKCSGKEKDNRVTLFVTRIH
jgi:hypothetical protein